MSPTSYLTAPPRGGATTIQAGRSQSSRRLTSARERVPLDPAAGPAGREGLGESPGLPEVPQPTDELEGEAGVLPLVVRSCNSSWFASLKYCPIC